MALQGLSGAREAGSFSAKARDRLCLSLSVWSRLRTSLLPDADPPGLQWRALGGGQSLGDLQETQRKGRSALISLSRAPREQLWAPGGNSRDHHGSAPCDSPETAGVGLAQDTVIRGRQGVKPEVGKALVGIGLRGGGALKSIVTGRRKTRRSGDRQWWGCEPAQGRCPTPRTHRGRSTGPVPEGRRPERRWLHSG